MVISSHAKLNLYLEVLSRRKDNYHNIRTLFERITLADKIVLKPRSDKTIKIICKDPGVPKGSSNLCLRAARLLQGVFGIKQGVEIRIIKRIPPAAGLGGGSSNAASVLLGLNKMWKLNLGREKLLGLGRQIGADVAFFLYDQPFAWGEGRGDEIKPLNFQRVRRFWHILVVPKLKVSTPKAYRQWDRMNLGLTKLKDNVNILNLALKKSDLSLINRCLFNSLEEASVSLHPRIRQVKEKLVRAGLKSILMSGSGPAMFSIVSSGKEAVSLARNLQRRERPWRVFAVRTF